MVYRPLFTRCSRTAHAIVRRSSFYFYLQGRVTLVVPIERSAINWVVGTLRITPFGRRRLSNDGWAFRVPFVQLPFPPTTYAFAEVLGVN